MFLVILDNREYKLIELFKSYHQQSTTFILKVARLDVGDIIIAQIVKDGDVNKISNLITFERKTIADMISSIKDGRYKEQKMRLRAYIVQNKTHKIQYILEGDTIMLPENEKKLIWGGWISTLFRDKIDVIRTISIRETYQFITRLVERLEKVGNDLIVDNNDRSIKSNKQEPDVNSEVKSEVKSVDIDYLNTLKTKKKNNITPKVCQILAIGTIPGISNKTAEIVINHYGSLQKLMLAYISICNNSEITDDEKLKKQETMLSDLKNPVNNRKLGVVSSKKIYEYMNI